MKFLGKQSRTVSGVEMLLHFGNRYLLIYILLIFGRQWLYILASKIFEVPEGLTRINTEDGCLG